MNITIKAKNKVEAVKIIIKELTNEYLSLKKKFIAKIILQGLILLFWSLLLANCVITDCMWGACLVSVCCFIEGKNIFNNIKAFVDYRKIAKFNLKLLENYISQLE